MLCTYLLFASLGLAGATTQPADRPNVIVICADALSAGNTGFEGHLVVKTPNLDKLAAESVQFSRAYVAVPQTTGSRMSILTGRFPHSTGVMNETDAITAQLTSFPEELTRSGYVCGLVGSWKLPPVEANKKADTSGATPPGSPAPSPGGIPATPTPGMPANGSAPATAAADQQAPTPKLSKPGLGFNAYYAISDPASPMEKATVCVNGEEKTVDGYLPDWQTDRAIEFVRQAGGKPFCLCLFYPLPSMSPHYPPGLKDPYPPASLPPMKAVTHDSKNQPPRLGNCDPIMKYQSQVGEKLQQNQSKYYAMVTYMDENVGKLLRVVDELNLGRNTIVVFTSAKGFATGETGVWGNGPLLWEPFVRCQLLVRLPGARATATRTATATATATGTAPASGPMAENGRCRVKVIRMVSLVDIAPTLLEAVGLAPPPMMHGHSMMTLLRGQSNPNWPNECFIENDSLSGQTYGSRAIVADTFKFVDYLSEQDSFDQLYDLKRDPGETRNMVSNPSYSSMVKVMRQRLERWRKRMRDTATQ